MATATATRRSGIQRFAWTAFVVLGGILVLFGVSDLSTSSLREAAINELFIGLLTILVAATGLRRGERWAWLAMGLWPLWIVAQGLNAWSSAKDGEAITAVILLIVALAGLALSHSSEGRAGAGVR